MNSALPVGNDPINWLDWTAVQQSLASDPISSAWVSANAGSGKTHVLTQRVIRLLLSGCRPSSILCLTYTKAAASEMSNRVFQRLAEWAVLGDADLANRISLIEGHEPDSLKLAEARRLFAKALETPGGLKIQTIHAFCEALLHQFPLEANVAGHFAVLDDSAASALLGEARRSLLTATSAEDDPALAEAFAHVLDLGDEFGLETLLGDIIARRTAIRNFLEHAEGQGGVDLTLKAAFGQQPGDTEQSLADAYWPLPGLYGGALTTYLQLADEKGGSKVLEVAYGLRLCAKEIDPHLRAQYLDDIFLTKTGNPKADSSLVAKKMLDASPMLGEAIELARAHVVACRDRLRIMRMIRATKAALLLADRLNGDYEDLKRQRSLLDFEDLIAKTADLLTRDGVGAWVHYKLDQGIDHILVDEAQDTSSVQWTVIKSLAEDFYSGQSARDLRRTIFAVGDEKQSIYSFQGARPERFAEERARTEKDVRKSGQSFNPVRLPLSFRSTADVLAAVDQVFSLEDNARGLSFDREPIVHRSNRIGHPGAFDLWNVVEPEIADSADDWTAPFDSTPDKAPSAILAARIAHSVEGLIGKETIIEKGVERAIAPGDILVLVRKRDAFVNALTRALKRRGNIPVAGADRLRLTSHIAVQDLLALGRFLVLPQDDLSLSALLKSPLFNLSEEDVFEAAAIRPEKTSVWQHLGRLAEDQPLRFASTEQLLRQLLALSRRMSPHDLYARLLGQMGGRRKFLGRLGTEAGDILDEFLNFALDHEGKGLPGLQSFVSTLEMESPEIKREQDSGRNEVRIMTVHASKGLEAPIVFLIDGGSKAFVSSHVPKLRLVPHRDVEIPAWMPSKTLSNSITAGDDERLKQATEEEYRRLLYVGMTRAADRLVVCGYRGARPNPDTWHSMIVTALSGHPEHCTAGVFTGPEGEWDGFRWRLPASAGKIAQKEASTEKNLAAAPLPPVLNRPLPPQASLPRPLSPSGAGTMIDDDADDLVTASPLFGEKTEGNLSLQKGRLVHRMLQVLPDFPADERPQAARRYAERAARFWPSEPREALIGCVLTVLTHPDLQPVFSGHSRAEVSVMGTVQLKGTDYAISGRLDRMAVSEREVTILDYKTNRRPPHREEDVPLTHRAQLALYREILRPLYPDHDFRCVLAYTETGNVISLTSEILDRSLAELRTK
ncbi:double-strand break repair helicase AddA [Neorhizobium sp. T786]|uniref:double-strand break repair helicase AddA n=1 Tax=Pseudorhizobium xiangyangii TaxID=2883104 RepID=UPI001CFFFA5B|nr:double-strand break repair helicase AddA [Neorhizobium xiangyangii]MCB5202161.1 double-strand break repair helicase AddA [Neorhizobium xiangyangii]